MNEFNLLEVLNYIDPTQLDYGEWVSVGMALKEEGYSPSDWDEWSQKDTARYVEGECFKKWNTFTNFGFTGATITQMAKDYGGWTPRVKHEEVYALDWNATIGIKDYKVIDHEYIEELEIKPLFPKWNPVKEVCTYLETLFELEEYVGYVVESYQNEKGKFFPNKGIYSFTVGDLLSDIKKTNSIECLGPYNQEAGAWIRFNPLDGKGVKNENVTAYRYTLIECDNQEIEKQYAILKELELPIKVISHSGKKSLHAIVKVDARNIEEYKKRVDFIYKICKKNGLNVDTQNKNPSRLSRFPGFERGDKTQYIIATNIGLNDYEEWLDYIEDLNDELPEFECLESEWENLPPLDEELISGVLRKGHKMLISGPSKAGKSFLLMGLTIALAEGRKWLGWDCKQGKVLYINLELARSSCLHRFKNIYEAMQIKNPNLSNIEIWNLRGRTVPMDKLAPKIIRRATKKGFSAVIIDPIYKVLTGDENSADQMAHFTNQFDKVATELGTSVIYCHHHSKGSQAGKKAMDRSSGSGVFARDPDALLDLVELPLSNGILELEKNKKICSFYAQKLKELDVEYFNQNVGIDDLMSVHQMTNHLRNALSSKDFERTTLELSYHLQNSNDKTAWRVDGTLREFPKFPAKDIWFSYPLHSVDDTGILKDIDLEEDNKPKWKKNFSHKKSVEENKTSNLSKLEIAYQNLESLGEEITFESLAEQIQKSPKTVKRWIKESDNYEIKTIDNAGRGQKALVVKI